jgi:hypothetical protein
MTEALVFLLSLMLSLASVSMGGVVGESARTASTRRGSRSPRRQRRPLGPVAVDRADPGSGSMTLPDLTPGHTLTGQLLSEPIRVETIQPSGVHARTVRLVGFLVGEPSMGQAS